MRILATDIDPSIADNFFCLFRADVINDALAGKVHIFDVSQTFLLLTALYVTIPSLMIFLSLVMAPKVNR